MKQKTQLKFLKKYSKTFSLALLALLCATLARTIEIPLEGFGKSTKVAYVNMHKIFEAFPETEKARVEMNRLIDEKKAEITAKKEEIALLKGEVQFLRKQMSSVEPSTAPKTIQPETPSPAQKEPQTATSLTLPDGSPLKFIFSPADQSSATAAGASEAQISSAAAAAYALAVSSNSPQILPGIPSPAPQLKEKEALLSRKESELEAFVGAAETEVRQLEEGKTMTLLARIYKALEEIAAKEGYSVIVDKDNILYGENAVDITQSIIWRLSAPKSKPREKPQ